MPIVLNFIQLPVKTDKYDSLEEITTDVLKFVVLEYGELFVVIIIGMILMLVWYAEVWDLLTMVSFHT